MTGPAQLTAAPESIPSRCTEALTGGARLSTATSRRGVRPGHDVYRRYPIHRHRPKPNPSPKPLPAINSPPSPQPSLPKLRSHLATVSSELLIDARSSCTLQPNPSHAPACNRRHRRHHRTRRVTAHLIVASACIEKTCIVDAV
jgi:hypothetical protein